jgi:Fe-S-cluster containining protein
MKKFECRKGCGACCIAPSISSTLPGMPAGKPAGVRCVNLSADNLCVLYNKPERPEVCLSYRASDETCGRSAGDALQILTAMEDLTV